MTNFLAKQFDYIDTKMKEINISTTLSSVSQSRRAMHEAFGIMDPYEIRTKRCGKRLNHQKRNLPRRADNVVDVDVDVCYMINGIIQVCKSGRYFGGSRHDQRT